MRRKIETGKIGSPCSPKLGGKRKKKKDTAVCGDDPEMAAQKREGGKRGGTNIFSIKPPLMAFLKGKEKKAGPTRRG